MQSSSEAWMCTWPWQWLWQYSTCVCVLCLCIVYCVLCIVYVFMCVYCVCIHVYVYVCYVLCTCWCVCMVYVYVFMCCICLYVHAKVVWVCAVLCCARACARIFVWNTETETETKCVCVCVCVCCACTRVCAGEVLTIWRKYISPCTYTHVPMLAHALTFMPFLLSAFMMAKVSGEGAKAAGWPRGLLPQSIESYHFLVQSQKLSKAFAWSSFRCKPSTMLGKQMPSLELLCVNKI